MAAAPAGSSIGMGLQTAEIMPPVAEYAIDLRCKSATDKYRYFSGI